ncbi:excisionase [Pseudofrankia sp. BMG5.36]|nr:excisionase [Pseudofrankia sp. BMG5.36]
MLPLAVVLAELGDEQGPLARSTFDDWRAKGRAPRVIKLPNGQLRVARPDLNAWLDTRAQAA